MKKLYELYEHRTMKIRIIKSDEGYEASIDYQDCDFSIPWLIFNLQPVKSKMIALTNAKVAIENHLASKNMSNASDEEIFLHKHMIPYIEKKLS